MRKKLDVARDKIPRKTGTLLRKMKNLERKSNLIVRFKKSAKLLANRTSLREFLLSLLHHFLPERGFCALFLSFWLGAKPALHHASPLTFVNLLSKRSSTQQALLSSRTPLTHTHSQVYIITAGVFSYDIYPGG